MSSHQKQLEDLQRVYQWYITNKKQLCRVDKVRLHLSFCGIGSEDFLNSFNLRSLQSGTKTSLLESPRDTAPFTEHRSKIPLNLFQDFSIDAEVLTGLLHNSE